MTLKIQVLAWTRLTNVGGLNLIMGSQPSPLQRQFIYKQTITKTCTDSLLHQNTTYYQKQLITTYTWTVQ
jgi:hypothetical protein